MLYTVRSLSLVAVEPDADSESEAPGHSRATRQPASTGTVPEISRALASMETLAWKRTLWFVLYISGDKAAHAY